MNVLSARGCYLVDFPVRNTVFDTHHNFSYDSINQAFVAFNKSVEARCRWDYKSTAIFECDASAQWSGNHSFCIGRELATFEVQL